MITAAQVKKLFEQLTRLDPELLEKMFRLRVACGYRVVRSETFQTFTPDIRDGGWVPTTMGPLELINTLLLPTGDQILMEYRDKQNVRFRIVDRNTARDRAGYLAARARRKRRRSSGAGGVHPVAAGTRQLPGGDQKVG